LLNLNYTVTYISFESFSRMYVFAHHRRYNMDFAAIVQKIVTENVEAKLTKEVNYLWVLA